MAVTTTRATINYTAENIAAAYGIVSAKLGGWNLVAGLRGSTHPHDGKERRADYFSLHNANISYSCPGKRGIR